MLFLILNFTAGVVVPPSNAVGGSGNSAHTSSFVAQNKFSHQRHNSSGDRSLMHHQMTPGGAMGNNVSSSTTSLHNSTSTNNIVNHPSHGGSNHLVMAGPLHNSGASAHPHALFSSSSSSGGPTAGINVSSTNNTSQLSGVQSRYHDNQGGILPGGIGAPTAEPNTTSYTDDTPNVKQTRQLSGSGQMLTQGGGNSKNTHRSGNHPNVGSNFRVGASGSSSSSSGGVMIPALAANNNSTAPSKGNDNSSSESNVNSGVSSAFNSHNNIFVGPHVSDAHQSSSNNYNNASSSSLDHGSSQTAGNNFNNGGNGNNLGFITGPLVDTGSIGTKDIPSQRSTAHDLPMGSASVSDSQVKSAHANSDLRSTRGNSVLHSSREKNMSSVVQNTSMRSGHANTNTNQKASTVHSSKMSQSGIGKFEPSGSSSSVNRTSRHTVHRPHASGSFRSAGNNYSMNQNSNSDSGSDSSTRSVRFDSPTGRAQAKADAISRGII